ncbi:MAG TPA: MarR family transcriptional regulator [Labilithrix sp.]|jgi:DNA-binding MarR family transcriptional regulator
MSRPRIGALVRIAWQKLQEGHAEWLESSGYDDIQLAHSAAIQPLYDRPAGARLTQLARASRVTKQSMSALVDHLEARGYVERLPDPDDARASLVRLTARGRAFAREIRAFGKDVEAEWAERVGERRVEELCETLDRLRRSWSEDDA